jgi:hypothetical protein
MCTHMYMYTYMYIYQYLYVPVHVGDAEFQIRSRICTYT